MCYNPPHPECGDDIVSHQEVPLIFSQFIVSSCFFWTFHDPIIWCRPYDGRSDNGIIAHFLNPSYTFRLFSSYCHSSMLVLSTLPTSSTISAAGVISHLLRLSFCNRFTQLVSSLYESTRVWPVKSHIAFTFPCPLLVLYYCYLLYRASVKCFFYYT